VEDSGDFTAAALEDFTAAAAEAGDEQPSWALENERKSHDQR
jgi:hypothetical protein